MDAERIYWNEILDQIGSLTTATMILLIIVAGSYKKYWNRALSAAFWYYLATFLLNVLRNLIIWSCRQYRDTCISILDYWGITNYSCLEIFFYIKDYIFLAWFFIVIFHDKRIKSAIKWASILIALASVINYLFIEGYKELGVFNPGINMFYVIALPLIYLWYSQRESLRIPLKKNPYFWISIGLLIPNLLALFFYIAGDSIRESDFKLYAILNSVKNGFEIIGYILVGIGFSRARFVRFITPGDASEADDYKTSPSP